MTDMDVADTAHALGVSERTVRRWLREGRLAGYRVGRRIRIPENAVREAIAPYGANAPHGPAGTPLDADPIAMYLADPRRLRARREAAARVMDAIAASSGPALTSADTAEGLTRGLRDDEEHGWDQELGRDRP